MIQRRSILKGALAASALSILPEPLLAAGAKRPFKLFDTHTHFYTNDVTHYPINAKGARYGPEKMIAKAMAHPMTPEVIFKLWDENGVEAGCGVQYNSTYATDNRYLLDISAKYPKRIIPIVILGPTDPATPATLARMAKENRISGVRFTGIQNKQGEFVFLSDAAADSWAAADRLGLVIVLMPIGHAPEAMKRVAELADKYPNVKIVLDHVGFPKPEVSATYGLSPAHLALAKRKNVYYKFTTLLMDMLDEAKVPNKDFLSYAVGVYGADHFVWGSDVGNSEGEYSTFVQRAMNAAAGLSPMQQKALFHDTAVNVFIPGGRGPARA